MFRKSRISQLQTEDKLSEKLEKFEQLQEECELLLAKSKQQQKKSRQLHLICDSVGIIALIINMVLFFVETNEFFSIVRGIAGVTALTVYAIKFGVDVISDENSVGKVVLMALCVLLVIIDTMMLI